MNILYCGDKKVLDGLIISVLSLAKQTKEPLNIFVLTMYLKGYEPIPYESIDTNELIAKDLGVDWENAYKNREPINTAWTETVTTK